MGLLGIGTEKRTQLYFRDDGKFEFRKLEIEDTFLQEKNKDGVIIRGWKHFFKNQFPFAGYKNIPSDMVTLSYSRDVILDPYGIVSTREKPGGNGHAQHKEGKAKSPIIDWLVEVGQARRLKMIAKRGKASTYDKLILFLGTALLFEILIIGIKIAMNRGGS